MAFDSLSAPLTCICEYLTYVSRSICDRNVTGTNDRFSEARMEHHNSKLFEVIQQTSVIYFGALQTPSIPFSSPINRMSIREVCRAVESPANDRVWDQYPGIFIWVLLVGCAAAEQGSTEDNYFLCLLIKVALGAGYGWLDALTEAVKSFIRVKTLAGG